MRAVIVEREVAAGLAPLLESRPAALLPVANRPLIDLQLEALAAVGVRTVDLYLRTHPERVREHVQEGARWGVKVRYHSVRAPERCLAPGLAWVPGDEAVIALALDLLWSAESLARQRARAGNGLRVVVDARVGRLPIYLWQPGGAHALAECDSVEGWQCLDGPRGYVAANRALLQRLGETPHVEQSFPNGLYLGAGAQIADSAKISGPVLVGASTRVEERATVGQDAVIGAGCLIDEGAEIDASVVLPGSYVGPSALLRYKIVDGGWLIDVRSGQATFIDDPVLVGSCARREREALPGKRLAMRVAAFAGLLAAVLPVVLWGLGRALRGRPVAIREERFVSGGRDLTGRVLPRTLRLWSLASGRAAWRHLPWLLAVLRGELALLGVAHPARVPEAVTDVHMGHSLLVFDAPAPETRHAGLAYLLQNESGAALRAFKALLGAAFARPALERSETQ